MELIDYLYSSIKEKRSQVEIFGNLYGIDLDTLIRTAITNAKMYVSYVIYIHTNCVVVCFTYYDHNPYSRDTSTVINTNQIETTRSQSTETTKIVHLTDDGTADFIYQLDVMKGNVFIIHSDYPKTIKDIFVKHGDVLVSVSEGVDFYYYEITENDPRSVTAKLTLVTKLPYIEFVKRIRLGEDKARAIAYDLFRGVTCPQLLYCLFATAYIQLNVRYDHEYWKSWQGKGHEKQNIDNHTCYGSLVLGKAVCEGYSWGLIKILRALGVEAIPVYGIVNGHGHEWTKVKVDGEWYNIDSTIEPNPYHIVLKSFLVSDDYLRRGGYTFESPKYKATNTKYETRESLANYLTPIFNRVYEYERAGVNPYYLHLNYYFYPLK